MPKLLLITASSEEIRRARRTRFLNFQQITMPYLAARVPAGREMTHADEEAENIDWSCRPDVVGITFHTSSAYHAYDVAARFRSRGVAWLLGLGLISHSDLMDSSIESGICVFVGQSAKPWIR